MLRLGAILIVLSAASSAFAQEKPISISSPDGKRTIAAKDKVISVTDNATQKLLMKISASDADITGLGISPDGKSLGSVDKGGLLKLFDAAVGREILSIKAGVSGTLSFSADGKTFAVKSDKVTKTYDLATGKEVK